MSFTPPNRLKIKLKKFLILFLGLYIMIAASLYAFQEKILFLPTTLAQDYSYEFSYNFEELFFNTEENVRINAIHFKMKNPKGVILYFHGNAGDLSRWGSIAEYFVEMQHDVLIMDYRTYGKSTGDLSENGFYTDAQYCYTYLLKHYSENDITVYGRSLGTGIASYLGSTNKPKQLILETPYYSISDVAQHRLPIFPVKSLLKYNFPTYEFLPKVSCPITIIHGTEDEVVPYSSAEKLMDLKLKNLNFVTVQSGNHNNLVEFEAYRQAIENCLQ
jgi:fermentation-respiration switch protein FrsA (DUF1100 family)